MWNCCLDGMGDPASPANVFLSWATPPASDLRAELGLNLPSTAGDGDSSALRSKTRRMLVQLALLYV